MRSIRRAEREAASGKARRGQPFAIAWSPSALRDLARLAEKVAAAVEFVYGGQPLQLGPSCP